MRRAIPGLVELAIAFVLLGVAPACNDDEPKPPDDGIEREQLSITTANGDTVTLFAEVAVTPEERALGLMGRQELARDSGMLFVIEPPGRGFWMKGTVLPLTVAFISACGEIVDFADMEPLSEEIKNTDRPYAYALEMEQGWFRENGVAAGDSVLLPERLRSEDC